MTPAERLKKIQGSPFAIRHPETGDRYPARVLRKRLESLSALTIDPAEWGDLADEAERTLREVLEAMPKVIAEAERIEAGGAEPPPAASTDTGIAAAKLEEVCGITHIQAIRVVCAVADNLVANMKWEGRKP